MHKPVCTRCHDVATLLSFDASELHEILLDDVGLAPVDAVRLVHVLCGDADAAARSEPDVSVVHGQVQEELRSTPTCDSLLGMVLATLVEAASISVDADEPLMEAGVDSLSAVDVASMLDQRVCSGVRLPRTLVFDYPTARAIAVMISSTSLQLERAGVRESGAKSLSSVLTELQMQEHLNVFEREG